MSALRLTSIAASVTLRIVTSLRVGTPAKHAPKSSLLARTPSTSSSIPWHDIHSRSTHAQHDAVATIQSANDQCTALKLSKKDMGRGRLVDTNQRPAKHTLWLADGCGESDRITSSGWVRSEGRWPANRVPAPTGHRGSVGSSTVCPATLLTDRKEKQLRGQRYLAKTNLDRPLARNDRGVPLNVQTYAKRV